jgi:hypothetical protein
MTKAILVCTFLVSLFSIACDIPTKGYVDGMMQETSQDIKDEIAGIINNLKDDVTALLLSGLLGGGNDEPEPDPEPEEEPIFVELADLPNGAGVYSNMIIFNKDWRDRPQLLIPMARAQRGSGDLGGVISLDMSSGATNWTYFTEHSVDNDIVVYHNEVFQDDAVLITDYKQLHNVNAHTGEMDWTINFPASIIGVSATKYQTYTYETIAVSAGKTVYMYNSDRTLAWKHDFEDYPSAPLLDPRNESFVYVSVGNCVHYIHDDTVYREYCGDGKLSEVMYNKPNGYLYVKSDNEKLCYLRQDDDSVRCFSGTYDVVSNLNFSEEGYVSYSTMEAYYDGTIHYKVISSQYFDRGSINHNSIGQMALIDLNQWVNPPVMDKNNMIYMTGDYNFVYGYDTRMAGSCGGYCLLTLDFIGKSFRSSPVIDKHGFLFVATTDGMILRIDTNRWE